MNSKGKQKSHQIDINDEIPSEEESEFSEEIDEEYFEASSESEPDTECSIWDNDCKIIPKVTSSLVGYHLMPTCDRDPDFHHIKRQKLAPEINRELLEPSFVERCEAQWKNGLSMNNVEMIEDPYNICIVNNFLHNTRLLNDLRQEFYELDWNIRSIDLYEFFQSKDLQYLHSENLRIFLEFLKTDVMCWVSQLTHLNLTHISAHCSIYTNTDYLLVHDDQREDRLVAFILYLTGPDGWHRNKGGTLDLFDRDSTSSPKDIVKSVLPCNNQFVFFPVSSHSYHQVAEITTLEDCRLSINGWFHGKVRGNLELPHDTTSCEKLLKAKAVDIDLESWISDEYLNVNAMGSIQRQIEENSEICLRNFFKEESFNEILQTLQSNDVQWMKVYPPNRFSYDVINLNKLPHSLERFLNLMQSTEMFNLLHKYTDLELEKETASVRFELQRWTPGSYSLLTDYDWHKKNELDLIMYFGCKKASDIIGARTQYVAIEDEIQNALITLEPEENNLNIVYRDSARFTKYYSKQSKCQSFYTLICSYSE